MIDGHYRFELAAIMVLFLSCPILECTHVGDNMENVPSGDAPVEVAAVLLNCDLDSIKDHPDSRASRFEREQLYKHNALQDCNKKLAITVKMSNEASTEDSYVPIDHVLDGSSTKRVRLLDPYVLRLRRDVPLQAYKLRLIDTVSGILTSSDKYKPEVQEFGKPSKRNERDTASSQYYEEWSERGAAVAAPARRVPARRTLLRAAAAGYNHDVVQDCGLRLFSSTHGEAQTSALPPASSPWPLPPRLRPTTRALRRGFVAAYTRTRHADCGAGRYTATTYPD
ncbi:hypothetical protein MSG28_000453 [Choristoneura fumiferana]|uniref:Uncharacterized protein n=1 Tax=Choristoneura fumiferana TaxID=7141 RepID=A0ACC0K142_CHOFU|nr:hypothetical protein MSG28_000453 [Choristoneura fumiferana]